MSHLDRPIRGPDWVEWPPGRAVTGRDEDLIRIRRALLAAAEAVGPYRAGTVNFEIKSSRGDPLTVADHASNAALFRAILPRRDEGWLSEETPDDQTRVGKPRVWVVDPIDGTREFLAGVPEWTISVGLVENGRPVAGGVLNPTTGECVVGSVEAGVEVDGIVSRGREGAGLEGARVLASRTEVSRGLWSFASTAPFDVVACGSVAYKLALVAAGAADATFTLVPKNQWDVAAGAALVLASGGHVLHADGSIPRFNTADPLFPDFLAGAPSTLSELRDKWIPRLVND